MQILITTASLLFWSNKALLLLGKSVNKKLGWFCGSIAAILFIVYFFLINAPILSITEIGLTILMTYRFIASKTHVRIENLFGIITALIIVILTILTGQGAMTFAQFFGALGMLIGTYFLIRNAPFSIKERTGWLLYGCGHIFTSYIGYQKQEWIFFIFQAWQLLLCASGFLSKNEKQRKILTIINIIIGGLLSWIFTIFIS